MALTSEWFYQSREARKYCTIHLAIGFLLPNFQHKYSLLLHISSLLVTSFTFCPFVDPLLSPLHLFAHCSKLNVSFLAYVILCSISVLCVEKNAKQSCNLFLVDYILRHLE